MKNTVLVLLSFVLVQLSLSPLAEARGRTGSHRVGSYNSHGKGSHYVGGYKGIGSGKAHRARKHR